MHCSNGTTEHLTETCLFPPERTVSKNSVMGSQISNRNPGIVQTSNTYRAPVMSAVASGTQLSKGSEAINERTKSFFQAGTDAPKITTMIERAHHGKHEWSRFGERGGAPP